MNTAGIVALNTKMWNKDSVSSRARAYGFIAGPDYFASTYQGVELSNLQPNTTYHFRIRARDKDITRNTVVSVDYTFTTSK